MFVKIATSLTIVLISITLVRAEYGDTSGMRTVLRLYDECHRSEGGVVPCLKKKAIFFFDRATRLESIPLADGVSVIKSAESDTKPVSESEIEQSLPRGLEARDDALTEMLIERVASFANSRTIQFSLPKMSPQELGRGLEEGRGKMKKMMGMMAMGFAMKMAAMVPIAIAGLFLLAGKALIVSKILGRGKMKKMMGMMAMGFAMKMAAMVPIAIAGLFLLAGKALIVSKIALLLSGIIALKKLLAQKNSGGGGGGGHESHGWSSGGSGSGGWDRRSLNDVTDMAYSAYKKP